LTYSSDVSVVLLLSASASAAAPAVSMLLPPRLQRGEEGKLCSRRDRTADTEQGARDLTYSSDVSVALLLSASESAAAPALPMTLSSKLQRGEEGQSWS
jgi:hypothetical protein